jgi:hypothetical protein
MWNDFCDMLIPILVMILGIAFTIVIVIVPIFYFGAKQECVLYNQKFGTTYTVWQFFWAGDTIKSFINQGEQKVQNIKIEGAIPVEIK